MVHVEGRPTVAEVSLGALRENCRQARTLVGDRVGVLAVVKADGYGHGAVASAKAFLEAGAVGLGVSLAAEGLELRRAGITAPIVVLGGVFDGEEPMVVANDMAAAVWTLERARALGKAAAAAGKVAALHVKVNTGMTRLGLDVEEVRAFGTAVRDVPHVRTAGVFSHFASADAVDTATAHAQRERFRRAVDELHAAGVEPEYVHLANSAAVLCEPEAHFNLVRPGLMLYGYAPAPHLAQVAALQPAMRLRTRIAQTRRIPFDTPVGYGGTWVASRPSTIATLPLGYADGLHRLASNRAQMLVGGRRVDIAGRVCMDHVMLDVTAVTSAAAGDHVVVFGSQGREVIGAQELAAWTDTITYEVLTSVGKRVPRVYVEEFDG
ncbi:MAG TPA: alanine racemase [Candidatus Binatia bacterium]|jgi:alanine racemase|nr:alanine racemase [Candidatus Binatia bacterium]